LCSIITEIDIAMKVVRLINMC